MRIDLARIGRQLLSVIRLLLILAVAIVGVILGLSVIIAWVNQLMGMEGGLSLQNMNVIVILSATLCLLSIEFRAMLSDAKIRRIKAVKRELLKGAYHFFQSTIYLMSAYFINLARGINGDLDLWIISLKQELITSLVSVAVVVALIVGIFYFLTALYALWKVGAFDVDELNLN